MRPLARLPPLAATTLRLGARKQRCGRSEVTDLATNQLRAVCHLFSAGPSFERSRSRRGNSLADHLFIFKAAPSKVVTMACISPSLVM